MADEERKIGEKEAVQYIKALQNKYVATVHQLKVFIDEILQKLEKDREDFLSSQKDRLIAINDEQKIKLTLEKDDDVLRDTMNSVKETLEKVPDDAKNIRKSDDYKKINNFLIQYHQISIDLTNAYSQMISYKTSSYQEEAKNGQAMTQAIADINLIRGKLSEAGESKGRTVAHFILRIYLKPLNSKDINEIGELIDHAIRVLTGMTSINVENEITTNITALNTLVDNKLNELRSKTSNIVAAVKELEKDIAALTKKEEDKSKDEAAQAEALNTAKNLGIQPPK